MAYLPALAPRSRRRLRRTLVLVAVLGAGATAFAISLGLLPAATVGLCAFFLSFLFLHELDRSALRRQTEDVEMQTRALVQIRPLLGPIPVPLGEWAADPLFCLRAVELVASRRPGLVIECGSGSSTVIVARCLRQLGHGRILSLEHDPDFAERTRILLREHGVADLATVVTATLTRRQHEGKEYRWYDSAYETLVTEPVGVLLVDGPPGGSAPRARFPALPLLRRFLAEDWAILMDDGDRTDERWIAHTWAQETGAALRHLGGGRGGWVLHAKPRS
jgi:Methyltransferase domain